MGWAFMGLRVSELKSDISDLEKRKQQNIIETQQLGALTSAMGDGMITADEIGLLSSSKIQDALLFQENAMQGAENYANQGYAERLADIYNASGMETIQQMGFGNCISLDGNGLDLELVRQKLTKEYLAEFANCKMEEINDQEKQLEAERTIIQDQIDSMKAELQSLEQAKSQAIKDSAPRYA